MSKQITLEIEQQSPDGVTLYASIHATGYDERGGVLGRGLTVPAAIADWQRRAKDDGHDLSDCTFEWYRRETRYDRLVELKQDAAGQWQYRICHGDDIRDRWQYGSFDREDTIKGAAERFGFDAVKS